MVCCEISYIIFKVLLWLSLTAILLVASETPDGASSEKKKKKKKKSME